MPRPGQAWSQEKAPEIRRRTRVDARCPGWCVGPALSLGENNLSVTLRFSFLSFSLVLALGLTATLAGSVPNYDAARAFGFELQNAHAQTKGKALVERVSAEGMRRRIFAPLGANSVNLPEVHTMWKQALWPALSQEIEKIGDAPSFYVEQIGLIEGERVITGIVSGETTGLYCVCLWLEERGDGKIHIVDLRLSGQSLEFTRRLRHVLVLLGAPYSDALDEEERTLAFASAANAAPAQRALAAMHDQQADTAFAHWDQLHHELRATRLWREMRDTLMRSGSTGARESWLAEQRAGKSANAMLALNHVRQSPEKSAALAALDRLIAEGLNSPALRAEKAAVLLEAGRPAEALHLARAVYQLNPFSVHACLVATRAALRLERSDLALESLRHWGRVVGNEPVDRLLAGLEDADALRASAAYKEWRALPVPAAVKTEASP